MSTQQDEANKALELARYRSRMAVANIEHNDGVPAGTATGTAGSGAVPTEGSEDEDIELQSYGFPVAPRSPAAAPATVMHTSLCRGTPCR